MVFYLSKYLQKEITISFWCREFQFRVYGTTVCPELTILGNEGG